MQPKVKIVLSVFTFAAMVLTGLAAAEQLPTHKPRGTEPLLTPNIITLSPKLVRKKNQFEKDGKELRAIDSVLIHHQVSQ